MQIKTFNSNVKDFEQEYLINYLIEILKKTTNDKAVKEIKLVIVNVVTGKVMHYEKQFNELQIFFYSGKIMIIEI